MAVRDEARIVRRIREAREQRERELLGPGDVGDAGELLGLTFQRGDRVFDTVTGEEGKVVSGTREIVLRPAPQRADGGDGDR